jgi:hypothetical protein
VEGYCRDGGDWSTRRNECEFDSFWLEHICFPLHFVAHPHSTLFHCPSGTSAFCCNHSYKPLVLLSYQFLRDAIMRNITLLMFLSLSISTIQSSSTPISLQHASSSTRTSLPLHKLPSMQQTPLTNLLMNRSSLVVPIRAYMHMIPFCCCTSSASRDAQVLVFLDAAAEEVCSDSCATHCVERSKRRW